MGILRGWPLGASRRLVEERAAGLAMAAAGVRLALAAAAAGGGGHGLAVGLCVGTGRQEACWVFYAKGAPRRQLAKTEGSRVSRGLISAQAPPHLTAPRRTLPPLGALHSPALTTPPCLMGVAVRLPATATPLPAMARASVRGLGCGAGGGASTATWMCTGAPRAWPAFCGCAAGICCEGTDTMKSRSAARVGGAGRQGGAGA